MRADCRNLLCVPRSRHASLVGSDALDAALQARAIFPVDAETILQYAFPCCRRGAPCCSGRSCCAHFKVHAYVNRGLRSGTLTSAERMWSTRIRWYDQGNHVVQSAWSHNRVIHNMTVERGANPNATGFTWFVGHDELLKQLPAASRGGSVTGRRR